MKIIHFSLILTVLSVSSGERRNPGGGRRARGEQGGRVYSPGSGSGGQQEEQQQGGSVYPPGQNEQQDGQGGQNRGRQRTYRNFRAVDTEGCDPECVAYECPRCRVDEANRVSCKYGQMHKRCSNKCCGTQMEATYPTVTDWTTSTDPYSDGNVQVKSAEDPVCPDLINCIQSCLAQH
eukprot:12558_1